MLRTTARLLRFGNRIADFMETPGVIRKVQQRKLTYLDRPALRWLAEQVQAIERENIPGQIVETGCALGGSSIVIAAAKNPQRRFTVYDVFGQIPAPSENDGADVHARYQVISSGNAKGINGNRYYGYEANILDKVGSNFQGLGIAPDRNSVHFVQGLYEDTLHPEAPVAFAHIDCDWYDSVLVCLQRIVPALSPGGRLVIDDYFHYSGCRSAVWDYFRPRLENFKFVYGPRLMIESLRPGATAQ